VEAGLDALTNVLLSQSVLIPNLVGTFVFALSGGVAGGITATCCRAGSRQAA